MVPTGIVPETPVIPPLIHISASLVSRSELEGFHYSTLKVVNLRAPGA